MFYKRGHTENYTRLTSQLNQHIPLNIQEIARDVHNIFIMNHIPSLPGTIVAPLSLWEPKGPVGVITDQQVWDAVHHNIRGLTVPAWRVNVTEATISAWDEIIATIPVDSAESILAVGGGLVHDAAKYIGNRLGLPVTGMPTALSVDAFFTAAAGYRQNGMVRYLETPPPSEIWIDFDVIAAAPPSVRAAGVCDVLSIATGTWDWQLSHERGRNAPGMQYSPWAAATAATLLNACHDACAAAGTGDHGGLKVLLDCLALEVQLCNQLGHPRPEEGSEHAFAYSVENAMGHGLPHGDLVGPGILHISRLQNNDAKRLEQSLLAAGVPLGSIPDSIVEATLAGLPAYVREHKFYYGIAWEL